MYKSAEISLGARFESRKIILINIIKFDSQEAQYSKIFSIIFCIFLSLLLILLLFLFGRSTFSKKFHENFILLLKVKDRLYPFKKGLQIGILNSFEKNLRQFRLYKPINRFVIYEVRSSLHEQSSCNYVSTILVLTTT